MITGNFINGSGLKRITIRVGDVIISKGFACDTWGLITNGSWWVNNVPKNVPIQVNVYGPYDQNGELLQRPTYLEVNNIEPDYQSYSVYFQSVSGQWLKATSVGFIKTPPPTTDCDPAACSPNHNSSMPELITLNRDPNFSQHDECAPRPNEDLPLGTFNSNLPPAEGSNVYGFTTNEILVCFDRQTQKWSFELLLQYIHLNYVLTICHYNIQILNAREIHSLAEIDYLPSWMCNRLRSSIKGHGEYPVKNIRDGFVFTEIIYAHENEHKKDWNGYIQKYLQNYLDIPNTINYSCDDFNNTYEAKQKIIYDIRYNFITKFEIQFKNEYRKDNFLLSNDVKTRELRRKKEIDHHQRKSIQEIVKKYGLKIKEKCGT